MLEGQVLFQPGTYRMLVDDVSKFAGTARQAICRGSEKQNVQVIASHYVRKVSSTQSSLMRRRDPQTARRENSTIGRRRGRTGAMYVSALNSLPVNFRSTQRQDPGQSCSLTP